VDNLLSEKAPQLMNTTEAMMQSGISDKDLPRHLQGRPNGVKIWVSEQVLGSPEGKTLGPGAGRPAQRGAVRSHLLR
jgi:hypothetical protein